jgi:ubiquinol oxidase
MKHDRRLDPRVDGRSRERAHAPDDLHRDRAPNPLERALVLVAQAAFFTFFLLLYLLSPRTAHRLVGYFEEQAVVSYSQYLQKSTRSRGKRTCTEDRPRLLAASCRCAPCAMWLAVRATSRHRDVNQALPTSCSPRSAVTQPGC